jgi:hypothetical protein
MFARMPCELEMDGTLAAVRVSFSVLDGDGDETQAFWLFGPEGSLLPAELAELREELTGMVRRTFDSRTIQVESVRFEPGSLIATLVLVGTIVIETGAFLSALREIRDAVAGPIGRFVERSAARRGLVASATALDADVVLRTGALDASVSTPASSPTPPAQAQRLSDPAIVILAAAALVALIIVALILAAT